MATRLPAIDSRADFDEAVTADCLTVALFTAGGRGHHIRSLSPFACETRLLIEASLCAARAARRCHCPSPCSVDMRGSTILLRHRAAPRQAGANPARDSGSRSRSWPPLCRPRRSSPSTSARTRARSSRLSSGCLSHPPSGSTGRCVRSAPGGSPPASAAAPSAAGGPPSV